MSTSSSSSSTTVGTARKIESATCRKDPPVTMTNNEKVLALSPGGKRIGCAVAASTSSSSENSDTATTRPTQSCANKRLKRVSLEESQDTPNNDDDATAEITSGGSGCACECHPPTTATTGCVPTSNIMDRRKHVHGRPPTPSSSQEENDQEKAAAAALVYEHVGYNSSSTVGSSSSSSRDNNDNVVCQKRPDYISWDDYFMSVAALSSFRSKDPHHASGCCLVDSRHRIVGIGYNGFPAHCSDDCLPWFSNNTNGNGVTDEDRIWLHTKYPYVCHAEVNAILNKCSADIAERGARLYVLDFPGNECAKVIIQAGLSEVIYLRDAEPDSPSSRASRLLFLQAGVRKRRHEPERMRIDLEFGQFLDDSAEDDKNAVGPAASVAATSIPATTTTITTITAEQEKHRDLMLLEAKGYDPCTMPSGKRTDYISWDDYYMAVAFLTAQRSKDPSTQVGACIVMNQRIVGLGYNGFPAGCSDDHLPWARTNVNPLHTKYPYVCHAEVNAILNKCTTDIVGASIYVALFPCNECTKVIIQAGIREVVYMSDKYHDTDSCRASRIMLQMAGVKLRNYVPSRLFLSIHLGPKPA